MNRARPRRLLVPGFLPGIASGLVPGLASGLASALMVGALAGCTFSTHTSSSTTEVSTGRAPAWTSHQPPSTSTPSTGSTSSGVDYANLLIKPGDIPIPGFTLTRTERLTRTAGVDATFSNSDGSRLVVDTISVAGDASAAAQELAATASAARGFLRAAQPQPLGVGTDGAMLSGKTSDGTKQVTLAVFQEGRSVITLEFDSAAGDVVPATVVIAVATAQDSSVRAGLPS